MRLNHSLQNCCSRNHQCEYTRNSHVGPFAETIFKSHILLLFQPRISGYHRDPFIYEETTMTRFRLRSHCSILAASLLLLSAIQFLPQDALAAPPGARPASEPSTGPSKAAEDKLVVTHHSMTLAGQPLDYEATAGTIVMKDESGKPRADFFFVAYQKEPAASPRNRPITFVFNGGPGAAAVWLHLGTVGPQRVMLGDDGVPGPPPHGLVSNEQTWLDLTDLVFIDPVGTGYSRPAEGQKAEDFWGVQQDIDSVGDFIRLYLTRYQRWDSPKFLAGESYGTTRAAGLSQHLLDRYGIDLNGIILISTVLNFETLSPANGNDLPYQLYLPSFTAIANFHHKIKTDNEDQLLSEVSKYATGDYAAALAKGAALTPAERKDVVDHLSRYTGLPADLIDKTNLRIDPSFFRKHLLEDQKLIIGRFDARLTGLDPEPANANDDYDPSEARYLPVYSGAFNDYIRRDLKFESDLNYEVLSGRVRWDFGRNGGGYLDVTSALRSAMLDNPNLKVMVASGYEDLATPFLATAYTFDRLDLTSRLQANVTQQHYHSGHMIYHDSTSRQKLKRDVAAFIASAAGRMPATQP
jgi:carboxypeptidase C (cathepsin A)